MTVIISERSCFSIKLIWMQLSIISSQTWAHYFEYAKMNITFFLKKVLHCLAVSWLQSVC